MSAEHTRRLNWLRKNGTKKQKDAMKGSGMVRIPDGPKGQFERMIKDIKNRPWDFD